MATKRFSLLKKGQEEKTGAPFLYCALENTSKLRGRMDPVQSTIDGQNMNQM